MPFSQTKQGIPYLTALQKCQVAKRHVWPRLTTPYHALPRKTTKTKMNGFISAP